jgi:CubicO group peptidase (beta-lactamase class C family)
MQLEEQAKINLDEDINTYLPVDFRHPDFPNVPITTRMLLTHTAGLSWPQSYDGNKGMWNQFEPDQSPLPSEWIPEYLIPSGMHYDASLWKPVKPGTHEFYSNIGICVVAFLVEQISGKNFREYCKDCIFTPLGMHSTSYNYADLNWDKIAFMYDSKGIGTAYFDNRVYASGGAKTTVRDLSLFAMCYINKGELDGQRIMKETTVNRMLEVQNQASGLCLTWESFLGNWFGHTGGLLLGATSNFMIHPDSKMGIIIFTNTQNGLILPGGDIYWLIKQKANEYID